jgi:hypothetical protein
MSLSEATLRRLPKIKAGLLDGKTSQEIADQLHVRRETIERDKQAFRSSGIFEDWIREEWMRLHQIIVEEEPSEAYRQVSRLVGQMLTRKIERKDEIRISEERKLTINIRELLAEYEPALERARHRNLQTNNPTEQMDPAQANPETS